MNSLQFTKGCNVLRWHRRSQEHGSARTCDDERPLCFFIFIIRSSTSSSSSTPLPPSCFIYRELRPSLKNPYSLVHRSFRPPVINGARNEPAYYLRTIVRRNEEEVKKIYSMQREWEKIVGGAEGPVTVGRCVTCPVKSDRTGQRPYVTLGPSSRPTATNWRQPFWY